MLRRHCPRDCYLAMENSKAFHASKHFLNCRKSFNTYDTDSRLLEIVSQAFSAQTEPENDVTSEAEGTAVPAEEASTNGARDGTNPSLSSSSNFDFMQASEIETSGLEESTEWVSVDPSQHAATNGHGEVFVNSCSASGCPFAHRILRRRHRLGLSIGQPMKMMVD